MRKALTKGLVGSLGVLNKSKQKILSSRPIPHMGWNEIKGSDPLLKDVDMKKAFTFHSYF